MKLYGIDGCKDGCWVVAEADGESNRPALRVVEAGGLGPIFREAKRGEAVVVIDIPIGLPERGPRPCDQAARKIVGGKRASSVFPVPCRAALTAAGERASEINFRRTGKRLSKQSQAILDRIREVDQLMTPELQAHVREGHPEVIFAKMNGRPLKHGKKSREGEQERLCLLRKVGIVIDPHTEREQLGRAVGFDDIIDAVACLATARRIVVGAAQPVAPLDRRGLRMEIVVSQVASRTTFE